MKILYVHGYEGRENGSSSDFLRKEFKSRGIDCEVYAPSIPLNNPDEAIDFIFKNSKDCDYVVASSMGAFYAMMVSSRFKILVNLALPKDLKNTIPSIDDNLIKKMNSHLEDFTVHCLDSEYRYESFFVIGDNDEVVMDNNFIEENYYPDRIYHVDMEHKLNEVGAKKVVDLIEYINDGHAGDIYEI